MSAQPVQPLSLSAQAGLVSLELIHRNCLQLENGYIKHWLPMLTPKSRDFEEILDCSKLDLESIVLKYEEMVREKRKGREWRAVKMYAGIPRTAGGSPQSYVRYKKCSYLYTVARWREALMSQAVMTPEMMNGLVELAVSLYRPSKDRLEPGALTLQAVLTCQWTERLLTFTTGQSALHQCPHSYYFVVFQATDPTDPTCGPPAGRPQPGTGHWRRRTPGWATVSWSPASPPPPGSRSSVWSDWPLMT